MGFGCEGDLGGPAVNKKMKEAGCEQGDKGSRKD